ncbi:MAG: hypothetical protein P4N59_16180, partial [Negativicutes bacterium]|nr:hypothetical protein [Negativicutes bacterium]
MVIAMASPAMAVVMDNETRTVTSSDVPDFYSLGNQSHLIVQPGANLIGVSLLNSTLDLSQATTGGITAQGSTVALDGAQVDANSRSNLALTLTESTGTISNSKLANTNGVGMLVTHSLTGTTGSTATVGNSTITGTTNGVGVFGYSTLILERNSQVYSTATGSAALIVRAGTAQLTDSLLHGAQNGVIFCTDSALTAGQLSLDGSDVVGVTGAAIRVEAGTSATIDITNKSTLTGGNGNILEVDQGSTAAVSTQNVALEGNVLVTGGSTADLAL